MTPYSDFEVDPIKLAKAARKQAEEHPNFIYTSSSFDPMYDENNGCFYTEEDGMPGCIFGHAMSDLGKPLPSQTFPKSYAVTRLTTTHIDSYEWHQAFGLDEGDSPRVVQWMREVQNHQDARIPWGRAVELADDKYPDVADLTR